MPPYATDPQALYATNDQLTAGPAEALLMLFDRLVLDLAHADTALATGALEPAHHALLEAQQIVEGLRDLLDTSSWPEGTSLVAVYDYLYDTLVEVNLHKDRDRLEPCRQIVADLARAWGQAAATIPAQRTSGAGRVA